MPLSSKLPKNKTVFGLPYFLSNPKDWYVISRKRVCNPFATQTVCHQVARLVCFFLRIDYIPPTVDYIHGVAVITCISCENDYIPQHVADYMQCSALISRRFYAIIHLALILWKHYLKIYIKNRRIEIKVRIYCLYI